MKLRKLPHREMILLKMYRAILAAQNEGKEMKSKAKEARQPRRKPAVSKRYCIILETDFDGLHKDGRYWNGQRYHYRGETMADNTNNPREARTYKQKEEALASAEILQSVCRNVASFQVIALTV